MVAHASMDPHGILDSLELTEGMAAMGGPPVVLGIRESGENIRYSFFNLLFIRSFNRNALVFPIENKVHEVCILAVALPLTLQTNLYTGID